MDWKAKIIVKWIKADKTLYGWTSWEAGRLKAQHPGDLDSIVEPLAREARSLCLEKADEAPAMLTKQDIARANFKEVARAFLAQEEPVEVAGTCPTRETYLAAVALASDPNIREIAMDGDLETAMDRVRTRILEDMPDLPEGIYRDLLVNALEGVSWYHLIQGIRKESE